VGEYGILVGIDSFEGLVAFYQPQIIIYDNVFYSKIVCSVYKKINISTVDGYVDTKSRYPSNMQTIAFLHSLF